MFDITDFDETLPGPFDWDLRRLATSFVIAAREPGFKSRTARDAVGELTAAYRDHISRFARMDTLEAWYWRLSSQTLLKLSSKDQGELAVIKKARRNTALMFAEEATEKGKGGRLMSARSRMSTRSCKRKYDLDARLLSTINETPCGLRLAHLGRRHSQP